jgi:hypothetical protein
MGGRAAGEGAQPGGRRRDHGARGRNRGRGPDASGRSRGRGLTVRALLVAAILVLAAGAAVGVPTQPAEAWGGSR